jgi:hypothetical protein
MSVDTLELIGLFLKYFFHLFFSFKTSICSAFALPNITSAQPLPCYYKLYLFFPLPYSRRGLALPCQGRWQGQGRASGVTGFNVPLCHMSLMTIEDWHRQYSYHRRNGSKNTSMRIVQICLQHLSSREVGF